MHTCESMRGEEGHIVMDEAGESSYTAAASQHATEVSPEIGKHARYAVGI